MPIPDGSQENTELSHRLLVLSALMMAIAAILWGSIYAYFGEYRAAIIPWSFSVISFLSLTFFRGAKRFHLQRTCQLFLSLMLPFLLMWELGGFVNSSAVVIWSLTSPMGALVFAERKTALRWFIAFVLLILIGATFNFPSIIPDDSLPAALIVILFVMNLSGVSIVAFVLLLYFVKQKNRTLALLDEERHRSENLIRNMLPESIGERLKQRQSPIADRLDNVTILFADISGFTSYSMDRRPEEIVALLDEIFSHFDEIAKELGLEKIKTIGDAYMLCGGLEGDAETGARNATSFAWDAMRYINNFTAETGKDLGLRVGINTGAVVAGVIGHSKYSYDIWGDAVNIAARLQQTASTGDILLSENTATLLDDTFKLKPQGETKLKGHTPVITYTLQARSGSG